MTPTFDVVGNRTVPWLLRHAAAEWGDRVFVETTSEKVTFSDMLRRVEDCAGRLAALGVSRGDRVVVHMENRLEWLLSVWGAHFIGAVAVTTNTLLRERELDRVIEDSEPSILLTSESYASMVSASKNCAEGGLPVVSIDDASHPAADSVMLWRDVAVSDSPLCDLSPDALASILYTSGSTAGPKGVKYLHGNHVFAGLYTGGLARLSHADCHLLLMPLAHMAAQSIVLYPSLAAGARIALAQPFSARRFSADVERFRPTTVCVTSQMVRAVVSTPASPSDGGSSLGHVYLGLKLDDRSWDEFESRFGCRLHELLGQTEVGTIQLFNPIDGPLKRRCSGMPGIGYELRLVDESGNDVGPGEAGEMLVRGPTRFGVTPGYWRNEEATAELFRDGWLRTGDVMRADQDGYFYFVERLKRMIKRSGFNVAAAEIEEVLETHPAVRRAAVIGVPDQYRDEAIVAFVELKDRDGTAADLDAHCEAQLAPYKRPSKIELVDEIPYNFVGKIDYQALRDRTGAEGL